MTLSALLMMIFMLALVWGGFIFTLRMAIKKESSKSKGES